GRPVFHSAQRLPLRGTVLGRSRGEVAVPPSREGVGRPDRPGADPRTVARVDLRDELADQVERTVAAGGRLVLGGEVPEGEGAFYPPTLIADVDSSMPLYRDETFGPVAAVIKASDLGDAVRIANDSDFGLGAAIFTSDVELGERVARDRLQAGACFVNALVASDPRLPFGGIKMSGYGRELADFGMREFLNIKTVVVG